MASSRFFCVAFFVAFGSLAHGQTMVTERVSVRHFTGSEANPVFDITSGVAMSADGRFVAFSSYAPDLIFGDTNDAEDVFVRDRLTGFTIRMSIATDGTEGNNGGCKPSISADGRFVAFESYSGNLVSDDTNGQVDVFVRDRDTDADGLFDEFGAVATYRVNYRTGGTEAQFGSTYDPRISADGRYITYWSNSAWLVSPGPDTNGTIDDVFVTDIDPDGDGILDPDMDGSLRTNLVTTVVSVSSAGVQGTSRSRNSWISGDGRYVAFHSLAGNLVSIPKGPGFTANIFLHDRDPDGDGDYTNTAGTTTAVSIATSGTALGNGISNHPSFSQNGRTIAFHSDATDLVTGDTNGFTDIFIFDLTTGITKRVNISSAGAESNATSSAPALSGDARYVSFRSAGDNLLGAGADTNGVSDIFVHDRDSDGNGVFDEGNGTLRRANVASDGTEANGESPYFGLKVAPLSWDGSFTAFDSEASNLIANDTNDKTDVFVNGPTLNLSLIPAFASLNDTVTFTAYRGVPFTPFQLRITRVNGVPFSQGVLTSTFFNDGTRPIPFTITDPNSVGNEVTLNYFGFVGSKIETSNEVTLTIR